MSHTDHTLQECLQGTLEREAVATDEPELSWEDEKAQDDLAYESLCEQSPDLEPPF